jgi:hypothetical protein
MAAAAATSRARFRTSAVDLRGEVMVAASSAGWSCRLGVLLPPAAYVDCNMRQVYKSTNGRFLEEQRLLRRLKLKGRIAKWTEATLTNEA